MKKYLILIIAFLSLNFAYGNSFINEINFIDDEYIEIYSTDILNLSNNFLYDDYGYNKSNFLEKVSIKNSSYYLIVGDNFLKNNNYSVLNCSIFRTKKDGIGHYNLKDNGENITIKINNSYNLSWIKDKNYAFLNQSLSYNLDNFSYYKSNKSPCLDNIIEPILSTNISILENISTTNITSNCSINFSIIPKKMVFENRIEYEFETNISDFYIEYWIEDYSKNVVKSKRNTTNLNTKYFTPDNKINIFYLKANLFYGGCVTNKSKLIMFYSPIISEENQENSCKIDDINANEIDSYIKILNEDSIKNQEKNILYYEIYKGDTSKRSIYFYLNNKEISSFEISKYTKIKGRLKLNLNKNDTYNLSIFGLNLKEEFVINNSLKEKVKDVTISKKIRFLIQNFTLNDSILQYNLDHNLNNNFSSQCYITNIKTKVSNILNLSLNSSNYYLTINESKLFKKEKKLTYELKLTCKYKDKSKKYYTYESKKFIFSVKPEETYNIFSLNSTSTLSRNIDMSPINEIKMEKKSSSEALSGHIIKKNTSNISSFYFILVGLVLIVIILISKR